VTGLDGIPNAVTSAFSYEGPFGQLSSATDPLGHSSAGSSLKEPAEEDGLEENGVSLV